MNSALLGQTAAIVLGLFTTKGNVMSADVAPGGGLGAVGAKITFQGNQRFLEHRGCAAKPCDGAGGEKIPITLQGEAQSIEVVPVALGEGRSLLHAKIVAAGSLATWEALIVPTEQNGSKALFAGPTGLSAGGAGDRRGEAIKLLERDGGASFVVMGAVDEAVGLCGDASLLLGPRALDPRTMTFRPAAVQQLGARRANATRIGATMLAEPAAPPLGRLLAVVGSTDERGKPAALVDNDARTRWSEARSGIGAGELVVFRLPNRVPLTRFTLTALPPLEQVNGKPQKRAPSSDGSAPVAPKSLYLAIDDKTFAIDLPAAIAAPGATVEIKLPQAMKASCLALSLDDAYAAGVAKPEVSIAELAAYSELDTPGATPKQLAAALSGGGPNAEVAAEVLKRGGAPVVQALPEVFDHLDATGRMLGLEVASAAGGCDAGARVFVHALVDNEKDIASRAEKLLLRCGPSAAPALLDSIAKDPPPAKARAAEVAALVAASRSLKPIGLVLGQGDSAPRAALRSAFARAARTADAATLKDLLGEVPREARPEMVRALRGRLPEIRERASLVINEWLEKEPSFAARYLALEPLAELARAGDSAATTRFVAMLDGDADAHVRSHAAALAGPVPAAHGALLRGLDDAEPRVREAALVAVKEQGNSAAAVRVSSLLAHDPWTFVRTAAAAALGGMAPAPDLDRSLELALKDPLPHVRIEALSALARHRAQSSAGAVRERFEDDRELLEVRVAAIRTLAALCDGESLDAFTKAAQRLVQAFPERSEIDLGAASVRALGAVHPKDLQRRLAPLLSKEATVAVREMATRALSEPPQCR